jgi:signal transduction histidine kinase
VVANAIKYTPDGGTITVDGRLLPGFIEMTVTDTGIGIDPENHIRIFEKFGRIGDVSLHSSGKIKFKGGGPGLGLPITKGIIEAHGGAIWVESEGYDEELCPGATFHILMPVRKQPPDDKTSKLFQTQTEEISRAD